MWEQGALSMRRCIVPVSYTHLVWQEAFKTDVVDTTAAGDTFSGYFLKCILNQMSVKEALRTASFAASIAVSRKGAAASIPMWDEVAE